MHRKLKIHILIFNNQTFLIKFLTLQRIFPRVKNSNFIKQNLIMKGESNIT